MLRRRWIDLALCACALVYALPTLAYGEGTDQAAFHYMGREWLRGAIPYRDSFEVKPPGIYAVYAIGSLLSPRSRWGEALLEIAAVIVAGWLVAIAARRERPGEPGALTLLVAGCYYTLSDHWDTGQVEIWEALALIAAWAVIERDENRARGAFVGGALAATAMLFKPTALLVDFAFILRLVQKAWPRPRDIGVALSSHLAGGLAPILACVAYFAAHHAVDDMIDILWFYNATYFVNKATSWPVSLEWTLMWLRHAAFYYLTLMALALFSPRRSLWPMFLTLLAVLSMAVQRKFYSYHWIVATPFLVLGAAKGLGRLRARLVPLVALAIVATGFVLAPHWIANREPTYLTFTRDFYRYLGGALPRAALLRQFTGPGGYQYWPQEKLGKEARQRANPGDRLCVHGFAPAFYIASGLSCPSRFFSDYHILDGAFQYKRGEWIEEHRKKLADHPPRFAIGYPTSYRTEEYVLTAFEGGWALFERRDLLPEP